MLGCDIQVRELAPIEGAHSSYKLMLLNHDAYRMSLNYSMPEYIQVRELAPIEGASYFDNN
jgi:hypothetical protein